MVVFHNQGQSELTWTGKHMHTYKYRLRWELFQMDIKLFRNSKPKCGFTVLSTSQRGTWSVQKYETETQWEKCTGTCFHSGNKEGSRWKWGRGWEGRLTICETSVTTGSVLDWDRRVLPKLAVIENWTLCEELWKTSLDGKTEVNGKKNLCFRWQAQGWMAHPESRCSEWMEPEF